jgi:hypothetical protein
MGERTKQLVASALAIMLLPLPSPAIAQLQSTISPALPSLNTGDAGEKTTGDADPIYCRPPQQRLDSRLMGPKVCMTIRKWNELHAGGFDIGPDGNQVALPRSIDELKQH